MIYEIKLINLFENFKLNLYNKKFNICYVMSQERLSHIPNKQISVDYVKGFQVNEQEEKLY